MTAQEGSINGIRSTRNDTAFRAILPQWTSSISVISTPSASASWLGAWSAAAFARGGRRNDNALTRQVLGKGLTGRPLARERSNSCRPRRSVLGGDLILGGSSLELLKLQLHLVEDACNAL